jgi:hypothetical protein
LFEEIATLLGPKCEDCGKPAKCVRMRANPPTGLDGSSRVRTRTEWHKVLWDLHASGPRPASDPDLLREHVLTLCTECYWVRTPKSAPKATGGPGELPARNESVRAKIRQLREQALRAYGGQCVKCGHTDLVDLRLRLSPDLPKDYWAGQVLDTYADKYQSLAERSWPNGICEVWCSACEGLHPQVRRTRAKQNLRERVVAGFGGRCLGCETEADPRTVWVVQARGLATLAYEGGRKMNTRDKYETLLRMGCPAGWGLVCPPCYARGVRPQKPSQRATSH